MRSQLGIRIRLEVTVGRVFKFDQSIKFDYKLQDVDFAKFEELVNATMNVGIVYN